VKKKHDLKVYRPSRHFDLIYVELEKMGARKGSTLLFIIIFILDVNAFGFVVAKEKGSVIASISTIEALMLFLALSLFSL